MTTPCLSPPVLPMNPLKRPASASESAVTIAPVGAKRISFQPLMANPTSVPCTNQDNTSTRAKKRPRIIASTMHTTVKRAVTPPPNKSPIDFLRQVLSVDLDYDCSHVFEKPEEQHIAAYDLDIVNAVREGNVEKLRQYHAQGKSLDAANRFGESLVHMACRRGNPDVLRFLVEEARVELQIKDDYGRTPLHDACWTATPNVHIMDILLQNLSSPQLLLVKDIRGHSPFNYARQEHWGTWIRFLTKHKDMLVSKFETASELHIKIVA